MFILRSTQVICNDSEQAADVYVEFNSQQTLLLRQPPQKKFLIVFKGQWAGEVAT